MKTPIRCAVDASVAMQLFVREPGTADAETLFDHLASDPEARFSAPSLIYAECANILWKYVRRFTFDPREAERSVARLNGLDLDVVAIQEVSADALRLAIARDITVYDALYAEVARRLDVPLVTADARLARKLGPAPVRVLVLGTFPIPPPRSRAS
jgi:predicted nucleic acid-binding protein